MSEPTSTKTIIVIGASSFIAKAFIEQACNQHAKQPNLPVAESLQIITISRQASIKLPELMGNELTDNELTDSELMGSINHQHFSCDYQQASIEQCVTDIAAIAGNVTRIVMCNGILHSKNQHINTHEPGLMPEKRIEDIDAHSLEQLFYTNSIVPMLWLSALTPLLSQARHKVSGEQKCVISILSARVGSISDNRLGGWYGYRASKAALNMLIKTTAVEYARRLKRVKLIAFHPGTTDTPLSKPFQANVPQGKLFTPAFVASQLHQIMDNSEPDGEASYLDWQGEPINW